MKGKTLVLGIATTALLFTLTACGGGGDSIYSPSGGTSKTIDGNVQTVRLSEVIRSVFYAPQYVALQKGYFKNEGLDVQLDTAWGGDKAMTRLLAGQADVALIGAETTIFVQQQGSPDAAVSFAQCTQRDGSFLVSRQPIANFQWSSLKGHSLIGSRKGSMPEMVSEYVQKKNGLKPLTDDQIIQNIDFNNQTTAFAGGTGDFYQAFEPAASILEQSGQGHVVASFGQDGGKLPYTVFISKASYLKSHPDVAQKFTNAIQQAETYLHTAKPDDVADVLAPYFTDVDHTILANVVKRYQATDSWPTDPVIDRDEFNHMKDIMKEAGELKADVPYETVVNTTFAEKAKAN